MSDTPAIEFDGITKRFPGVVALEDVSVTIAAGSCHALCGENGAGKSTLGKILAGLYRVDAGRVRVFGREVHFTGPEAARRVSDRAARLAVLSVVSSCTDGDVAGALVTGIRILADQAGTLPERSTW